MLVCVFIPLWLDKSTFVHVFLFSSKTVHAFVSGAGVLHEAAHPATVSMQTRGQLCPFHVGRRDALLQWGPGMRPVGEGGESQTRLENRRRPDLGAVGPCMCMCASLRRLVSVQQAGRDLPPALPVRIALLIRRLPICKLLSQMNH